MVDVRQGSEEDIDRLVSADWTSIVEPGATSSTARKRTKDRARVARRRPKAETAAGGMSAELAHQRFINRELSWLDFNARVLALAEDPDIPLLERCKFMAICGQGLDEFFQVRVAGLKEQLAAGGALRLPPDGMGTQAQLAAIAERVTVSIGRQDAAWTGDLQPRLREAGYHVVGAAELNDAELSWLAEYFRDQVFPVLTPLAVDPAHPFPYISNLSLNLAVLVRDPQSRSTRFARVKVPPLLPRFVELPGGNRFVPLEQVIAANLDALFPGMTIVGCHPFRVTRNGDLDVEEDGAEDLLIAIESELRRRRRFADVVRLEVERGMPDRVLIRLKRELELSDFDVYIVNGLLDVGGLSMFHSMERPDLKDEAWGGVTPLPFEDGKDSPDHIFTALRAHDVLVHHPYDSFRTTVEDFIEAAASDPDVLAIKMTLYRTAGPEGGIMRALMRAAEAGKQVVTLVELKARFEEQANIVWARLLEEAGVHVVYGLVGLKTHAKTALVVRRENDTVRHYVHIGTGNYNPQTARIYEDIGLLSADPVLGTDLVDLFNHLTGYSKQRQWNRIIVAPDGVRQEILRLIQEQSRIDGQIVLKLNSLIDPEIIEALYAAGNAGARIDLIVRGICGLRPGIAGQSETIRVRSLVGRYLEHSRILRFGGGVAARYLIGSADMMQRNLDRRVEVLVPIESPRLRARLEQALKFALEDDALAWELDPDGEWRRIGSAHGANNTQERLRKAALERVKA